MSKIAFDLDGVLVPDFHYIPGLSMSEFYQHTLYSKPLFNPTGKFDVVTARLEEHRAVTEKWLEQLTTRPRQVFMLQYASESPAKFKFRTALEQEYSVYVESDASIVAEMKHLNQQHTANLKILHFDEFITTSLTLTNINHI